MFNQPAYIWCAFTAVLIQQSDVGVMKLYRLSFCCPDIDECSDRVLACHGLDEICTNTEGSFRCDCAEGLVRRDGVCVKEQQPGQSPHTRTQIRTYDRTLTS